jgi:hypothetical protein
VRAAVGLRGGHLAHAMTALGGFEAFGP